MSDKRKRHIENRKRRKPARDRRKSQARRDHNARIRKERSGELTLEEFKEKMTRSGLLLYPKKPGAVD